MASSVDTRSIAGVLFGDDDWRMIVFTSRPVAGNEDGGSTDAPVEGDGKEAVLRRLQALDAPKTAPKAATQTSKAGDLPDWAFFALPIAGMACAFASQFFLRQ